MEDRMIIILRAKKCLSCEPGGVCRTGGWSNLCLCCFRGANGQGWRIWNPGLFGASALEIELNTWNSTPLSVTQFCCPDLVFLEKSPKQTEQPVSMVLVLFYRESGALLWRELKVAFSMLWDSLYTGTLPCHLQSGWEPQHVMQSFWPNRGELLSGALKRSLMQRIKK